MHARIISERDFQTIHLKILIPNRALIRNKNLISYEEGIANVDTVLSEQEALLNLLMHINQSSVPLSQVLRTYIH